MPSRSASRRVGASWSPEMMARCLIPRARSPATISVTSGRTAACNSMAPPRPSSTATSTIVLPSAWASARAAVTSSGTAMPSISMKRRLPTRIVRPSIATVMPKPTFSSLSPMAGSSMPRSAASWRIASAIGWWNRCSAAAAKRRISGSDHDSQAWMQPTSGRSRVSVPVLSKSTVSTSFMRSSARPSLMRMPLLAHSASELSIASGAAMRMPVPRSQLTIATAPAGPIAA